MHNDVLLKWSIMIDHLHYMAGLQYGKRAKDTHVKTFHLENWLVHPHLDTNCISSTRQSWVAKNKRSFQMCHFQKRFRLSMALERHFQKYPNGFSTFTQWVMIGLYFDQSQTPSIPSFFGWLMRLENISLGNASPVFANSWGVPNYVSRSLLICSK